LILKEHNPDNPGAGSKRLQSGFKAVSKRFQSESSFLIKIPAGGNEKRDRPGSLAAIY
jgi:hypothetical protein